MIHLVIVRNPFDVKKRDVRKKKYRRGAPLKAYFKERGAWLYAIDGVPACRSAVPEDGAYIVIVPRVEGKFFGLILSIGLSILTSGIASGTILGGLSTTWRMVTAIAVGMIGGVIISKLTAPRIDTSNSIDYSQSQTYGWGGVATLTGQGHPLAITYGAMKSGGVLLSRHIISDGARQYLHLLYCAGEGELSEIRNIRINENPVENYKDVQVDIRLGTNDQTVIPNFADSYADQLLNYELTETWAAHEVQGNDCTGLELTVALPNGLYYSNDSGGMSSTSVTLEAACRIVGSMSEWMQLPLSDTTGTEAFLTRRDGDWVKSIGGAAIETNKYRGYISEATNKAIYRVYRFENLPAGRYEVRVRCTRKDGSTVRYVNRVYWSQLTQIVYDDFIHPGKALIGIRALATEQLSGNDPSVSWVQERAKVYVFNPYSKVYEEKRADNPAWACYDILHQCRKIGGRYIVRGEPAERISYDLFKAWAEQCAAKGYTFNYIYDSAMQVWEALRYPETVGRGKVVMQGTRFTCIYDYAAAPTQLFTVGNIKQNSFKEEFQGTQGRANAIEISFMNAAKNYERDVLPVFSNDYDASETFATPTQIELMGCTDVKQAYAHGKHALRANKYELRTCTFEAYVDAIASTLGDVILLQHDVTDWGTGGRVVAAEGSVVTLDRAVTASSGKKYRLMVRDSKTDELNTYDVKSADGATVTLEQRGEIVAGDLYTYGEATKEAKPFRILSITKGMTEQTRKITCMEYYPELYADDDANAPIIDYTTGSDALTVQNLIAAVDIKTQPDGTTLYDIAVSWQLPRGRAAKQVKVEYKRAEGVEYTAAGLYDGTATSCVIAGVAASVSYTVRVTCCSDVGSAGKAATQTVYTVPKDAPPSKVQGFTVKQDVANSSVLQLAWQANPEADVSGYRLYDGAGAVLVDLIGGTSYSYFIPASGTYAFGIKAVNRSGVFSEVATEESIEATVASGSVAVPDAPEFLRVWMEQGKVIAEWSAVGNTYIDSYKVLLLGPSGRPTGAPINTTDIRSELKLQVRQGEVVVLAHNPVKGFGIGKRVQYDFPPPPPPTLRLTKTLQGFNISIIGKPVGVSGVRVYISRESETETIESTGLFLSYNGVAGIYEIRAAFLDALGEGVMSEAQQIVVALKIDKDAIENLTVTQNDLDAALKKQLSDMQTTANQANTAAGRAQVDARIAHDAARYAESAANRAQYEASDAREDAGAAQTTANGAKRTADTAISRIQKTDESITSIVARLSGNPQNSGYSAITQLYNGLQLKVNQGDVVSAINVSPWGVRIDGRLLHITGNTQFDGSIIANHMIQAGAVTADKLSVGSLSAVCATIGNLRTKVSGARTEIKDNLIEVFDENNQVRVRIGVF